MNAPMKFLELGAAALAKLIQHEVTLSIQNSMEYGGALLRVRGKLGTVRDGNYAKAFGVKLVEGADEVLTDIPKELIARHKIKGGEVVVLTGHLTAQCSRFTNHRVEIHLDAVDLEKLEAGPRGEEDATEQMSIARLRGLGVRRQLFPVGESIRLSLVVSKSGQAQVDQDFLLELQSLSHWVQIERIPVNILSAQEIADGIKRATGNVVAVIRGGGSAEQFDVFEDPIVVDALAAKEAYRVLGLGHTANTTVLDLLADYAATTPTRAGAHVRETILHYNRAVIEASRRVAQEKDSHIQSMQDRLNKSRSSRASIGVAFAAGAIAMVLLVAFVSK